MVGFVAQPIIIEEEQEQDQGSNSKNPKHPLDPLEPGLPDFSFVDSLLDFDFMEDFLKDTSELDNEKKVMEIGDEDKETSIEAPSVAAVSESMAKEEEPLGLNLDSGIEKTPSVADVSELMVNQEPLEVEKEGRCGNFDSSIEEKLGRFSLVGNDSEAHSAEEFIVENELLDDQIVMTGATVVAPLASIVTDKMSGSSSSSSGNDDDDDDDAGGGGDSDSESGKESASSSSEEEDDDDDDNDEEKEEEKKEEEEEVTMKLDEEVEEGEMEEGEIRDDNGDETVGNSDNDGEEEEDGEKMFEWSDSEFVDVDEEEDFGGVKGPIKSKNEVEVLPPVPPVEATLQPQHEMLPVGIVLSTLGAQVIVEGTDKHNPLNEGSILWITEKRSPLGIVDEIFGPVQNPYYVVRYNSETEVPAGINQGTLVSFVTEFAHHVLGEKNLYKKGYDASGEHDEELTDDSEFSDDEKEAEHRRMQKMSKRGLNQQTGNDSRRKNKNRNRNRNGNGNQNNSMPPPNQNQQNQHNNPSPSGAALNNGASFFPPFRPMVPPNGNFQPPNGGWLNPMPSQQGNAAFVPGGFPGNNMPWPAQNQPFQQPFNLNQGPVPNGVFPGGQMNLFGNGPSPWQNMAAQNCFNQALLGLGFQMQQPNLPMMNLGGQGGMICNPNQPQVPQNSNFQPPQMGASGDTQPPQQFNSGASPGRGSRPFQRGGSRGRGRGRGRFSGGRGR